MYTKLEMFAYAEGYHDGRMDYEPDNYFEDIGEDRRHTLYNQGYEDGINDRSEADENN